MSSTYADALSLRAKIGQMLIIGFDGKTLSKQSPIWSSIVRDNLGGVILFDYNYKTKTFDKNIESPEQVRRLNQKLQQLAKNANIEHHRERLPLIISVDYEGGHVDRLKASYGFPKTISAEAFAKLDETNAKKHANQMAMTLSDNGFNLDFAPLIDVNVNPENPVIGKLHRSFSSDPHIVSLYANIFSASLKAHQLGCVYKHFPGHGSSSTDSHLGFVDVTDTWQDYELIPYQNAFSDNNHCQMVMTAHIINRHLDKSGLPATLSKPILQNLLRDKLGFKGVIVSDDMQMKAISENFGLEKALVLAINAGVDLFIFGNQLSEKPISSKKLIDIIEQNVKSGKIDITRIDKAYERIKAYKLQLKK